MAIHRSSFLGPFSLRPSPGELGFECPILDRVERTAVADGSVLALSLFHPECQSMKNCLWLAMAFAVVFGVFVSESDVRGGRGGGGGGRPGGGAGGLSAGRLGGRAAGDRGAGDREVGDRGAGDRGAGDRGAGDRQIGDHQFSEGQLQERADRSLGQRSQTAEEARRSGTFGNNRTSQLKINYTGKNQPFSSAWYGNHPSAWQSANLRSDAWTAASLGSATAWLGARAIAATNDTVYTGESDSDDNSQDSDDSLTQEGETPLPADEEFLPLGVFALAPQQQTTANSVVQLAISRDGIVRGTYVDLLTNQEQSIEGPWTSSLNELPGGSEPTAP